MFRCRHSLQRLAERKDCSRRKFEGTEFVTISWHWVWNKYVFSEWERSTHGQWSTSCWQLHLFWIVWFSGNSVNYLLLCMNTQTSFFTSLLQVCLGEPVTLIRHPMNMIPTTWDWAPECLNVRPEWTWTLWTAVVWNSWHGMG